MFISKPQKIPRLNMNSNKKKKQQKNDNNRDFLFKKSSFISSLFYNTLLEIVFVSLFWCKFNSMFCCIFLVLLIDLKQKRRRFFNSFFFSYRFLLNGYSCQNSDAFTMAKKHLLYKAKWKWTSKMLQILIFQILIFTNILPYKVNANYSKKNDTVWRESFLILNYFDFA